MKADSRLSRWVRLAAVAGLVAGVAVAGAPASRAADVPIFPGSLPDTSSATTVSGRGAFSGLAVHVNQTDDLASQALSLSWSWPGHATKRVYDSLSNERPYGGDYLQVMQCWGDAVTAADVASAPAADKPAVEANVVADNPGPPREQCQFGASSQAGTGLANAAEFHQINRQTGPVYDASDPAFKTVAPDTYGLESVYKPDTSVAGKPWKFPEVPFRPIEGDPVVHETSYCTTVGCPWINNYYNAASSNEIPVAPVYDDGTGGATFQAQNSLDAGALGCGTGSIKCWLVLVPRTDHRSETQNNSPDPKVVAGNKIKAGKAITPDFTVRDQALMASPLSSSLWAQRIAIPLQFRPTLSPCSSATTTYDTVGSDLASNAMLSWQAKLCSGSTSGVGYNFTSTPDQDARSALTNGASDMRLLTDPVPANQVLQPIVYAPLTASATTVSFIFDPGDDTGGLVLPVNSINLNQRLIAKMLTYSYRFANSYRLGNAYDAKPAPADYAWLESNKTNLLNDPEFWAINPDLTSYRAALENLDSSSVRNFGTLQVSSFGSDGYRKLWAWILANPAAKAFLEGKSDDSGMVVNPYFLITDKNPEGAGAFDPANLDTFPSLDPWQGFPGTVSPPCPGDPDVPTEADQVALAQRNLVTTADLRPYPLDRATVARNVSRVDPLNKYAGFLCPSSDVDTGRGGWKSAYDYPVSGVRRLLGVSDSASSARYGVATAKLPNASGDFVAPDSAGMAAALSNLTTVAGVKGFNQPDPSTSDKAAYPLTVITYGGVTTQYLDKAGCAALSALVDYAAGDGQTAGTEIGNLPAGYVPLPDTLRQQALDAARTVAQCAKAPVDDPSSDPPPSSAPDAATGDQAPTDDGGNVDNPSSSDPAGDVTPISSSTSGAPPVSLASTQGTTKPDPSVIAWIVPAALLVGLLALLLGPLAGLRRRRPGQTPPGGDG
ncbi:hypothetical protein ACXR2U_17840 [Jatrophihabitans sp. YIM 134969]